MYLALQSSSSVRPGFTTPALKKSKQWNTCLFNYTVCENIACDFQIDAPPLKKEHFSRWYNQPHHYLVTSILISIHDSHHHNLPNIIIQYTPTPSSYFMTLYLQFSMITLASSRVSEDSRTFLGSVTMKKCLARPINVPWSHLGSLMFMLRDSSSDILAFFNEWQIC